MGHLKLDYRKVLINFYVTAQNKAEWLKRLLPAWTTLGNMLYISTDTYLDTFAVIGYHLTKLGFLSLTAVLEQIYISMLAVMKKS